MKHELDYFCIEGRTGGRQAWFWDPIMRLAGCAAIAASDSCISLARGFGLSRLCPCDAWDLTRRDYMTFAQRMKKGYLSPGWKGISRLELYINGLARYLADVGEARVSMTPLSGNAPVSRAARAIRAQLDRDILVPCLTLRHKDKKLDDYIWHWFLITGYEDRPDGLWVRATTYGGCEWISLERLWDTGYEERGGLILYDLLALEPPACARMGCVG